jgi:hypothetical protein
MEAGSMPGKFFNLFGKKKKKKKEEHIRKVMEMELESNQNCIYNVVCEKERIKNQATNRQEKFKMEQGRRGRGGGGLT